MNPLDRSDRGIPSRDPSAREKTRRIAGERGTSTVLQAVRAGVAATIGFGLIALTGCPTSVDFDDYESVNLIGTRTLSSGEWTPDDTTGTLMNWEVVSVSPPSGSSDTVYRMEVYNLFQDGDFDGVVLPGGWNYTDVSPPTDSANPSIVTTPDPAALDGDTLQLQFSDSGQRFYTDLSPATRLADGLGNAAFGLNKTFAIHMDLIPTTLNLGIELNDGNQANTVDPTQVGPAAFEVTTDSLELGNRLAFPLDYPDAETNTLTITNASFSQFSIGGYLTTAQKRFNGSIDNIRFVEIGPEYLVRTQIPYSDGGRPDLIPGGTYTISIAVRSDPTAGTGGRFGARQISLGLARISGGGATAPYMQRVDISSVGSSWERVSVEVPGPTFTNTGVAGSDLILELAISPTFAQGGARYIDAGSVLVSDPQLSWIAD